MSKTLTKKRIYQESLKGGAVEYIILHIGIVITLTICVVLFGVLENWGMIKTISRLLGILAIVTIPIIFTFVIRSLFTIYLIKKQEKYFGFNFNEEMKRNNLKGVDCQNNEWLFLKTYYGYVYAINNSYIESFNIRSGGRNVRRLSAPDKYVFFKFADGKFFKIALFNHDAEMLKKSRNKEV